MRPLPSLLLALLALGLSACPESNVEPGLDASIVASDASAGQDASAAPDADVAQDAGAIPDAGEAPDVGPAADGSSGPPELRSMTEATAVALASHARATRTQATGSTETTTAWSMVNVSCVERAQLLDWVIASAPATLAGAPAQVVRESDMTDARIAELIASPTYDSAIIVISGPLIAEQTIHAPDGTAIPGDPQTLQWAYHFGAVIKVDGVLKVMDLSVGDVPLDIDAWARAFVDPTVPCYLMDNDEYQKVWAYWIAATSNMVPDARPARVCGYQIYPFMRTRGDQSVTTDIKWIPWTLETQHGSFVTTLGEHGITPTDAEIPYYLSTYQALTEADICRIWDYKYCHP